MRKSRHRRLPFGPAELPSAFRGRVSIEADLCGGCGACVRDCPSFGLELEKESKDEFRLIYYPRRCIFCGQCEESYRFDATRLTNGFEYPSVGTRPSREVLMDRQPAKARRQRGRRERRRCPMSPPFCIRPLEIRTCWGIILQEIRAPCSRLSCG